MNGLLSGADSLIRVNESDDIFLTFAGTLTSTSGTTNQIGSYFSIALHGKYRYKATVSSGDAAPESNLPALIILQRYDEISGWSTYGTVYTADEIAWRAGGEKVADIFCIPGEYRWVLVPGDTANNVSCTGFKICGSYGSGSAAYKTS